MATTKDLAQELAQAERELLDLKKKVAELRKSLPQEQVGDYTFQTPEGTLTLADLFGGQSDLIMVHNMGKSCTYCTMWADGFQGILPHLSDRAAFAVISPDPPEVQQEFANSRGWTFAMASAAGTTFAEDMGYETNGKPMPGVSAFHKDSTGSIARISHAPVGPGDDFNAGWHLFDLLKDGPNGWQPKYSYE